MKNREGTAFLVMVFVAAALWAPAAHAQGLDMDPFDRGSVRTSVVMGWGEAFSENYFILGLGAGYFVANGLELGLDVEGWLGSDPSIYKLTPQVRYVFQNEGAVRPYLGAFYRRTSVSSQADLDSAGGRVGIYTFASQRTYFGIGAVFEYLLSSGDAYTDDYVIYPELIFAVAF